MPTFNLNEVGELEFTYTVTVSEAQHNWLRAQVVDSECGPTPECLDEAGVIRSVVNDAMNVDAATELMSDHLSDLGFMKSK